MSVIANNPSAEVIKVINFDFGDGGFSRGMFLPLTRRAWATLFARELVDDVLSAKMGSQVLVPFQGSEDSPCHLKLMGDLGQIVPMKYNPRDEETIKAAMAKANVVISLIASKDDGTSMGKVYELGGPDIFTVHELVTSLSFLSICYDVWRYYVIIYTLQAEIMFDMIHEWSSYVKVPFPFAKAIAMPREILLKRCPFPLPNPDLFNLGYPIEYLISYRKGGPQFGSTVSERVNPDAYP
ncbi:hypothetical protein HS088_TW22G00673 [Tripterygium wilfordii]|uniref:NmrA-like domain-containing protein n=1 Tax=Tripterygium wilfordii TaxID=458696 RepID=A0A7J7BZD5_TRIWF|nr:hypothetical protein HS088_TW22G00673 [Tripterygium wilfordii]